MANVATAQEVLASQAFLRQLGADWHSYTLIQGVVAWFRAESGSLSRVIGNNPFNIRDSSLAIGYRQTKSNGHFAIFKTLSDGFTAAAKLLIGAGNDWRGYGLIVRAARSGSVKDFLQAIAMSAWDAGHYGYPATNHLISVYNSITGLTLTVTDAKGQPLKPPRHRPLTPVPRALQPPEQQRSYIDSGAARRFYNARPHGGKPLDG